MTADPQARDESRKLDTDEAEFERWWRRERGDKCFDNFGPISVTEGQLFRWERQSYLAALSAERARSAVLVEALKECFGLLESQYNDCAYDIRFKHDLSLKDYPAKYTGR